MFGLWDSHPSWTPLDTKFVGRPSEITLFELLVTGCISTSETFWTFREVFLRRSGVLGNTFNVSEETLLHWCSCVNSVSRSRHKIGVSGGTDPLEYFICRVCHSVSSGRVSLSERLGSEVVTGGVGDTRPVRSVKRRGTCVVP